VALGAVTGNNSYFMMTPAQALERGLRPDELVKMSPAGSKHLREASFSSAQLRTLGQKGSATLLFRPAGEPSAAASEYIALGEQLGVDQAYKCRVRTPWWRVPLVAIPDLFITCMNAEPRALR